MAAVTLRRTWAGLRAQMPSSPLLLSPLHAAAAALPAAPARALSAGAGAAHPFSFPKTALLPETVSLLEGLRNGDRGSLSRAITLSESQRGKT